MSQKTRAYRLGRVQLEGMTDLHIVSLISVAPKCFSFRDFWRHLFSRSGYGSQESVFLEALWWFICMAKFRKYYFKWSHPTLRNCLFLCCINLWSVPQGLPLKFPLVFQGSNKAQMLLFLTGSIFQVRIKNKTIKTGTYPIPFDFLFPHQFSSQCSTTQQPTSSHNCKL